MGGLLNDYQGSEPDPIRYGRGMHAPMMSEEEARLARTRLLGTLGGGVAGGLVGAGAGGLISPVAPYTGAIGAVMGAKRGYTLADDYEAMQRGNRDAERQPSGVGFYGQYR